MKILFLFPYPLEESPSQRFRFEQYWEILAKQNFKVKKLPFWSHRSWAILYKPNHHASKFLGVLLGTLRRLGVLFYASPYDFIFIHRETLPIGPPIIEWILAKILRKKIIYDFDDAIWLPNTTNENHLVAKLKWPSKVRSICTWSYKVSCGNEYLGTFARQFNKSVVVNPTTIDTRALHNPDLYQFKSSSEIITIGWTGSHSTLPYLKKIEPVLISLEKKYPGRIRFVVIADQKPQLATDNLTFVQWTKKTEIQDLLTIDIGVMPLPEDEWSRGKCGLKALQFMALRIPTIASPVGVNNSIIEHGINGFFCESPESWEEHLEKLIENPGLRLQLGEAGRQKVIQHYSEASNQENFLSLFE